MIDKLNIANLTTMGEVELDLSPKMNVIIGSNGLGKTHLLKAGYGLACAKSKLVVGSDEPNKTVARDISNNLVRIFKPANDRLGRMARFGARDETYINALYADGESLEVRFSSRDTYATVHRERPSSAAMGKPVFIPTKEVLSFLDGTTSEDADDSTLDLIFDATYRDLLDSLSQPAPDEISDRLNNDPRFGHVFPEIAEAVGGKFSMVNRKMRFIPGIYDDRRVKEQKDLGILRETVFKKATFEELSGHMTAEGFRKIGVLQHLLANQSLDPGVSGPLFWDEPECNMNPRLMRMLVDVLLVLTRSNQQVIIATHDYFMLKWIDLLTDRTQGDHVRFHSLHRAEENCGVRVSATEDYRKIEPNPIADTFDELSKAQLKKRIGEVTK
ncbi:DNA replication and repair protein RecF [Roseimaritima multifibrata]|uniref:DNA replication and repair protein RecF n=1 Tax=Roseimaritima multifibrata TaxID=1930274 RepID=A0A517MCB7_9BACT|nr:AAA family ATPase [Roseimaritima multifibrata]QDS92476.1 DNA replication and repair protein RecF [Roseimaritima multifibrata]